MTALRSVVHLGDGVHFATTGRAGGVSAPPYDGLNLGGRVGDEPTAVEANRARLADTVGLPRDRMVAMAQTHGADIAVVERRPQDVPAVDGLVTRETGLVLVALGADCAPIMLADPRAGVIGVAHCGRLGLVRGIVSAVVDALWANGATSLVGRVGPAICGACYEVPAELRDEVADAVPTAAATTRWGTPGVDVGAGALAELRRLGVFAERLGGCTYEDTDLFSHRRDGVTGRQAGLAWRTDA